MLRKKIYHGLVSSREAWLKVRILFLAKGLTKVGKDGMDLSSLREACVWTMEQEDILSHSDFLFPSPIIISLNERNAKRMNRTAQVYILPIKQYLEYSFIIARAKTNKPAVSHP